MNKLTKAFAVTVVALGLVAGPTVAANAATPTYGTQMNTCRNVTVPPKLSGFACWNLFGANVQPPAACRSTVEWRCFKA